MKLLALRYLISSEIPDFAQLALPETERIDGKSPSPTFTNLRLLKDFRNWIRLIWIWLGLCFRLLLLLGLWSYSLGRVDLTSFNVVGSHLRRSFATYLFIGRSLVSSTDPSHTQSFAWRSGQIKVARPTYKRRKKRQPASSVTGQLESPSIHKDV